MQITQGSRLASSSDIPFCKFQIKPLENVQLPSLCTLVSPLAGTLLSEKKKKQEKKTS